MLRSLFVGALLVSAASAEGKAKKVALKSHVKDAVQSIANRYMDYEASMKLVELSTPKEDIINDLLDLEHQLIDEQNNANLAFASAKAEYENTIASALQGVDEQNAAAERFANDAAALAGRIAGLEADIDQQHKENADLDIQIKGQQAQQQTARENHEHVQADFDDKIRAHHESLDTLQGLVDLVNKMQFNDVLKVLNKHKSSHMHPQAKSLTKLVTAAVKLIQKSDGPTKNQIKAKLLGLLSQIREGTEDSLRRYQQEQQAEIDTFSAADAAINELLAGYAQDIANNNAAAAADAAQIADLQPQLTAAQNGHDTAVNNAKNLQDLADSTRQSLESAINVFNSQSANRHDQLSQIEEAIQYVNNNVAGLSVANLCNPASPDCFRCLTNEQCSEGQMCSSHGQCSQRPTPVDVSGRVDEHQTMTLTCPGDDSHVIRNVVFASYGMPNGDNIAWWCHAGSSSSIVSASCLNQHSCSVRASNDVFGDPCYGTFKHMNIHVQCL